MQLRVYQQAAIAAVYDYLRTRDDNPCVVIPTGGGKTPIIATICRDTVMEWGGRVLVLAHVKELLEQCAAKLAAICPEVPFGVYSAGLKRRDRTQPVIVAGIQSIYQRATQFDPFDLIIVDEAHLIPPSGEGMYQTLLREAKVVNPDVRIIGLTATPYRLESGRICGPANILNHICYEVSVRDLIREGYLSKLTAKASVHEVDTSKLHVKHGEYVASEVEAMMADADVVRSACAEIVAMTRDRKAVLIFCAGVAHGRAVVETLQRVHSIECGWVDGETPSGERARVLSRFRSGELKYMANVNVLTTGFDAPHIDCVVLLRPTLSPGLYYQMVGRGFRTHPDKQDCLVLDFGGNVRRHGPVDAVRVPKASASGGSSVDDDGDDDAVEPVPPTRVCPHCRSIIAIIHSVCPDCNSQLPVLEKPPHSPTASNDDPILSEVFRITLDVIRVEYHVHRKRDGKPTDPATMRVDYYTSLTDRHSEWICVEHTGYPRVKAERWWRRRSRAYVPTTASVACMYASLGALAQTKQITVERASGERYARIVDYVLGPVPDWAQGPKQVETVVADDTATTEEVLPW